MKCVHFTDIHVGLEGDPTHHIDVRANTKNVLAAIAEEQADVVVLTGDLCFKQPEEQVYQWLVETFKEFAIKPLIIPGNHDDRDLMKGHFSFRATPCGQIYFSDIWEGHLVLFLDTVDARMSGEQWDWIRDETATAESEVIIFMHHPPVKCDVPYMDRKHRFRQSKKFVRQVQSSGVPVQVFCGHYHVDKTVSLLDAGIDVHITPSCFFQIRQDINGFGIDHHRIGYRVIDIGPHEIRHTVRYLDGVML